ncbi:MAG: hypothetical protein JWQ14_1907 [Adhaeribacter sp.]|nr:hypothetical protein [Adhaeribacter sp.]
MKTFLLSLFLIGAAWSANGQDIRPNKVPAPVKNGFQTAFPKVKKVEWEKKNDLFEAEYKVAKTEYKAFLDANGKTIMRKNDITVTELPTAVTAMLAKNYAGYTVKDPEKIQKEGMVLYQVELEKGSEELKQVFSADGLADAAQTYWD